MEPYRNYSRNGYSRNNAMCDSGRRNMQPQCCNMPNMDKMRAPLAMAFVHMQEWCSLYSPDEALINGTAFPDLNLIFCGVRGKCNE